MSARRSILPFVRKAAQKVGVGVGEAVHHSKSAAKWGRKQYEHAKPHMPSADDIATWAHANVEKYSRDSDIEPDSLEHLESVLTEIVAAIRQEIKPKSKPCRQSGCRKNRWCSGSVRDFRSCHEFWGSFDGNRHCNAFWRCCHNSKTLLDRFPRRPWCSWRRDYSCGHRHWGDCSCRDIRQSKIPGASSLRRRIARSRKGNTCRMHHAGPVRSGKLWKAGQSPRRTKCEFLRKKR